MQIFIATTGADKILANRINIQYFAVGLFKRLTFSHIFWAFAFIMQAGDDFQPFAVGAHAVAKARLDKDSVSLVIGCGPVGLAVIAGLKAKGHGPVIAADFFVTRVLISLLYP